MRHNGLGCVSRRSEVAAGNRYAGSYGIIWLARRDDQILTALFAI